MLGREEINTLERTRAAIIKHEEWYRGLPEGSLEKRAEDQSLIPLKLGLNHWNHFIPNPHMGFKEQRSVDRCFGSRVSVVPTIRIRPWFSLGQHEIW